MLLLSRTNNEIFDFYEASTKNHIASIQFEIIREDGIQSTKYSNIPELDSVGPHGDLIEVPESTWVGIEGAGANLKMKCSPVVDSHLPRASVCMDIPRSVLVVRREILEETGLDDWVGR
ncbi:hypothetical protein NVP1031O_126 [Vibrio phage 1.031.O._10N.261.46.F8]|nr:hypothetical protein NVP1031O_126 [Vibrio phage 1.031.O._10N.261.46.F8]